MLECRPRKFVHDHPRYLADAMVVIPARKMPLKPCPAWDDDNGKHFWMQATPGQASEADRCFYCLQSRHASRRERPVLALDELNVD